jgi:frataxin-like iron-binding protein CyaY
VVDSVNDIGENFVIKEVKLLGIPRGATLTVGDEQYRDYDYLNELDNRINQLENKFGKDSDITQDVKSLTQTLSETAHTHIWIQSKAIGSTFVIGINSWKSMIGSNFNPIGTSGNVLGSLITIYDNR